MCENILQNIDTDDNNEQKWEKSAKMLRVQECDLQ